MNMQQEPKRESSTPPIMHRAAWVIAEKHADVPGADLDIIEDGALLVENGLIKAVGRYRDLAREFTGYAVHEHDDMVLAPSLVNCHAHLELSHLDFNRLIKDSTAYNGDITSWIRDLLQARESFLQDGSGAEEEIMQQAHFSLHDMYRQGVDFVGDIGNSSTSSTIGKGHPATVFFLLELLGLSSENEAKTFARLETIAAASDSAARCTAHAPYSTTPALIKRLKERSRVQGHIFSIHVAESFAEQEFLQSGSGPLVDFLHDRGVWDGTFTIPGMASVHYLDSLGVLDHQTLCVHAVHVEQSEVEILAKRRAKVCLCPGSNRFIGVGKAPVTEFLAHGILPALGTDSRASNGMLNMWHEMRLLREDHPELTPESVFSMATRGGAEAWGQGNQIGTLAPGKKALVLAIDCFGNLDTASRVIDYLTTAGESISVNRLE